MAGVRVDFGTRVLTEEEQLAAQRAAAAAARAAQAGDGNDDGDEASPPASPVTPPPEGGDDEGNDNPERGINWETEGETDESVFDGASTDSPQPPSPIRIPQPDEPLRPEPDIEAAIEAVIHQAADAFLGEVIEARNRIAAAPSAPQAPAEPTSDSSPVLTGKDYNAMARRVFERLNDARTVTGFGRVVTHIELKGPNGEVLGRYEPSVNENRVQIAAAQRAISNEDVQSNVGNAVAASVASSTTASTTGTDGDVSQDGSLPPSSPPPSDDDDNSSLGGDGSPGTVASGEIGAVAEPEAGPLPNPDSPPAPAAPAAPAEDSADAAPSPESGEPQAEPDPVVDREPAPPESDGSQPPAAVQANVEAQPDSPPAQPEVDVDGGVAGGNAGAPPLVPVAPGAPHQPQAGQPGAEQVNVGGEPEQDQGNQAVEQEADSLAPTGESAVTAGELQRLLALVQLTARLESQQVNLVHQNQSLKLLSNNRRPTAAEARRYNSDHVNYLASRQTAQQTFGQLRALVSRSAAGAESSAVVSAQAQVQKYGEIIRSLEVLPTPKEFARRVPRAAAEQKADEQPDNRLRHAEAQLIHLVSRARGENNRLKASISALDEKRQNLLSHPASLTTEELAAYRVDHQALKDKLFSPHDIRFISPLKNQVAVVRSLGGQPTSEASTQINNFADSRRRFESLTHPDVFKVIAQQGMRSRPTGTMPSGPRTNPSSDVDIPTEEDFAGPSEASRGPIVLPAAPTHIPANTQPLDLSSVDLLVDELEAIDVQIFLAQLAESQASLDRQIAYLEGMLSELSIEPEQYVALFNQYSGLAEQINTTVVAQLEAKLAQQEVKRVDTRDERAALQTFKDSIERLSNLPKDQASFSEVHADRVLADLDDDGQSVDLSSADLFVDEDGDFLGDVPVPDVPGVSVTAPEIPVSPNASPAVNSEEPDGDLQSDANLRLASVNSSVPASVPDLPPQPPETTLSVYPEVESAAVPSVNSPPTEALVATGGAAGVNRAEALQVLGFSDGVNPADAAIRKAFLNAVRGNHPDRGGLSDDAQRIINAYNSLVEAGGADSSSSQLAIEDAEPDATVDGADDDTDSVGSLDDSDYETDFDDFSDDDDASSVVSDDSFNGYETADEWDGVHGAETDVDSAMPRQTASASMAGSGSSVQEDKLEAAAVEESKEPAEALSREEILANTAVENVLNEMISDTVDFKFNGSSPKGLVKALGFDGGEDPGRNAINMAHEKLVTQLTASDNPKALDMLKRVNAAHRIVNEKLDKSPFSLGKTLPPPAAPQRGATTLADQQAGQNPAEPNGEQPVVDGGP